MSVARYALIFIVVIWCYCDHYYSLRSHEENGNSRIGKWFVYPYTSTVLVEKESIITEPIPSSCVVVNASLPPCRHVRQLHIQPTVTVRIAKTVAPEIPTKDDAIVSATKLFAVVPLSHGVYSSREESVDALDDVTLSQQHKPLSWKDYFINFGSNEASEEYANTNKSDKLSWAEYFGLEDVTVTKTTVISVTTKYYDPKTVITFSVIGCQPSKLPFNLPFCDVTTNASQHDTGIFKSLHYVP